MSILTISFYSDLSVLNCLSPTLCSPADVSVANSGQREAGGCAPIRIRTYADGLSLSTSSISFLQSITFCLRPGNKVLINWISFSDSLIAF